MRSLYSDYWERLNTTFQNKIGSFFLFPKLLQQSQPWKQGDMDFTTAIKVCFQKYASTNGRAVRSEFWYFYLFELIASIAGSAVDPNIGTAVAIITFLPMLTCSIRRLHDINRTGWWVLIGFTIIGIPVLIYWYCKKGDEQENRYGPASILLPSTT